MTAWSHQLVLLGSAALFLCPSLAAALNPLDNDAGSGGDAGDRIEFALPVLPGSYAGRLTEAIDLMDAYEFPAHRGEWLHLSLVAAESVVGTLYGPDGPGLLGGGLGYALVIGGEDQTVLIPDTGSWYIVVLQAAVTGNHPETPYWFTLQLSPAVFALSEEPPPGVTAYEMSWEDAARIIVHARLPVPEWSSGPTSMYVLVEGNLQPNVGEFYFGLYVAEKGPGRSVRAPLIGSMPLPDMATPPFRLADRGGAIFLDTVSSRYSGWVRVVLLHSLGSDPLVSISSDHVPHLGTGHADSIVEWTSAHYTGVGVAAPGLSIAGPQNLSLDVDHLTVGVFTPDVFRGTIESPEGNTVFLDFMDIAFMTGLADGRWQFGLDATAGAGPLAATSYLIAGEVPLLGIAPERRHGLGLSPFSLCTGFLCVDL